MFTKLELLIHVFGGPSCVVSGIPRCTGMLAIMYEISWLTDGRNLRKYGNPDASAPEQNGAALQIFRDL